MRIRSRPDFGLFRLERAPGDVARPAVGSCPHVFSLADALAVGLNGFVRGVLLKRGVVESAE
jgi:hypothetical protein